MDVSRTLIVIVICAAVTFLERALPFLIFGNREVPKVIRYLGRVLPMAIMATLVIYCIKGISLTSMSGWVPYLAGITVTAVLHWWRKNALLSIVAGTAVYMLLVQLVFV